MHTLETFFKSITLDAYSVFLAFLLTEVISAKNR